MFIGHFAVGFASKQAAPRTSLAFLLAAPLFLDLLWPFFLLAGWEKVELAPGDTAMTPLRFVSYPISHSLLMSIVWGALFGVLYLMGTRYRRGAIVLGLLVISHWFLDVIVHRPDLPLSPGSHALIGLGLWNSVPATVVLEIGMFAAGIWIYCNTTKPRDRTGTFALIGLASFLLILYVSMIFSPPPPSVLAIAMSDLAGTLLLLWAFWIDKHRNIKDQYQKSNIK